jgi:hypothetical protein
MTLAEKVSFIWDKAYTDALGAGLSDPFAYADRKADEFRRNYLARNPAKKG